MIRLMRTNTGKRTRKSPPYLVVRTLPFVEVALRARMDTLLVSMFILFRRLARMRRYFRLGMGVPIGTMAEGMSS